jgi:hypothetical protein
MISRTNKAVLSLALIASLGTTSETHAFNTKSTLCWIGAGAATLAIYWKIKKPVAMGAEETLVNSLSKARSVSDFVDIFERWVIGHKGKKASINLKADGKHKFAHELIVTMDKGIPAYGLCGVTWSYVKEIYEALKEIKDLNETARYFEIVE